MVRKEKRERTSEFVMHEQTELVELWTIRYPAGYFGALIYYSEFFVNTETITDLTECWDLWLLE